MNHLPLLLLLPTLAAALTQDPGARSAHPELAEAYRRDWAPRLQPLLSEVLRFPTVAGNDQARLGQQAWLLETGRKLGFTVRESGTVTEIELPGPPGAPVLGLVVHGDVQPAGGQWSVPPFEGKVDHGVVIGRGAADDKGPLVQALLAMRTLADSKLARTSTIRLLVGGDEESTNLDFKEYLRTHAAPAFSLVLDAVFPVGVGEKAWNALTVDVASLRGTLPAAEGRPGLRLLSAGVSPSIVPDTATAQLELGGLGEAARDALRSRLLRHRLPAGCTVFATFREVSGERGALRLLEVVVKGRAAHAGMNPEVGRNALVALADLLAGEVAEGGGAELLAFARLAGQDLQGTGLGLTQVDPVFGRATVVPTLLQAQPDGAVRLLVNVRSTPALSGERLRQHFGAQVEAFNARTGAHLNPGGYYGDAPLVFDPDDRLVKRLLASYARATGKAEPPAIVGGGTYAKRIPNAIVFGMWFPGKPYPGHDVDEQVDLKDLQLGTEVLLEALANLATGPPLQDPFRP